MGDVRSEHGIYLVSSALSITFIRSMFNHIMSQYLVPLGTVCIRSESDNGTKRICNQKKHLHGATDRSRSVFQFLPIQATHILVWCESNQLDAER